jgi:hypothetical protein
VPLELPDGEVVVQAADCSGLPVADSGADGGVVVSAERTAFTISLPGGDA